MKNAPFHSLPFTFHFLESPEEKRLRRVRAGIVTAASGLGVALLIFLMSIEAHDLIPFISLGVITFFIGLGLVINGLAFTLPRKTLADRSDDAESQRELDSRNHGARAAAQVSGNNLSTNDLPGPVNPIAGRPSVTEHTTHQLNPNKP
ncbi:MAG TPA: hypothetical protein VK208_11570 [Pyrinomonadaceae bacterium]|nr:hypothetical protein [Pyrinomonadaceae bacterium]